MDEALVIAGATTSSSAPPPALRLLSIDGGGIRGISALVILEEIMHRVQRTEKLSSVPLPADYFDLICGTSTGGLIALLLGRLRLSVPEAIDKYRILAEEVFSKKKASGKDGTFKASNLTKAIKGVVQEKLGSGHADERMFMNEGCKTFVCAMPAKHMNMGPRLFRTWEADKYPGYNCTIWEAGRATSAAPMFFKRIYIGDPALQEEFVDASMGCNNPVRYLIEEAQREFGLVRDVSCIVSIGTGKRKVAGFKAPGLFQRALPLDLINVLARIATDSENEALVMRARYQNCPGLYHRLNVERGLEEVALEEWKKLGDVKTHTMAYLNDINKDVDVIVNAMVGRSSKTFCLGQLDGTVPRSDHALHYFIYPPYRVNYFIPRTPPQDEIRKHFRAPRTTAMPTIVVLLGMGGCGKSQLALEYCEQSENNKSCEAIFWIDAISQTTIEQSLTGLARELSKPGFDVADAEGNVRFVLETISTSLEPWLLVFDNYDDLQSFGSKSIKDYFPRSNKGSILVTSRDSATRGLGYHIDVSTMSNEEAQELLFRRGEVTKSNANVQEGGRIIKRLGFHALAIDQAGAYIQARTLDLDLFLEHYNKRREEVLRETPGLWDYKRKLSNTPEIETKLSVFTTWELSFDLIGGDQIARDDKKHLLTLIAFFDGNEISNTLFEAYRSRNSSWMGSCTRGNAWDEYKFQDILKELRNLSLVQSLRMQSSGTFFSLHPLVQDWIKLRISSESRQAYSLEATFVLSNFMKTQVFHEMAFSTRQKTFSHLEAVTHNNQEYLSQQDYERDTALLDSTCQFATFLEFFGRYTAAERLFRLLVEGRGVLLGKDHPDTLTAMNELALSLQRQNKYPEAELIYNQTLTLREKILGQEHPDTLMSMCDFALLLLYQAKYSKAKPIFQQALTLREKVLGKEHPDTLTSMNNLALLLTRQGEYKEAESIHIRALALREKVLGKEHPDTLLSMNNLGGILYRKGMFDEAENYFQRTYALREAVLGKDHPDTHTSMNNFAMVLNSRGKYIDAEPIFRQALALREAISGKGHPNTLTSMNNLALVLKNQEKYDEAESIYRQTLALRERASGETHPDMLTTMHNLAGLYKCQGKYDEAEYTYQKTLTLRETVLGKEHPETLTTMNDLAGLYQCRGKYDEAESTYRHTLALRETVLGKENANTLTTKNELTNLIYMKTQSSG